MNLSQLQMDGRGRISGVHGDRPVSQRLMAMGFLPGEEVTVVQVAPFGDPITVALGGWRVSLRRAEAALVALVPVA